MAVLAHRHHRDSSFVSPTTSSSPWIRRTRLWRRLGDRNTLRSPRSAPSCCLCPFCCTRAMQTHCLPPHCSTLVHTAPHCSTHSTLLHNHRPLSRASGDKSFRRDVFSREARRHRLMCILAATPLLQLFLFCNCSRATSAGTRFNYTSAAQVLRPTQILPALGIQIMETTHTRKHQSQKTWSWLLNRPIWTDH